MQKDCSTMQTGSAAVYSSPLRALRAASREENAPFSSVAWVEKVTLAPAPAENRIL